MNIRMPTKIGLPTNPWKTFKSLSMFLQGGRVSGREDKREEGREGKRVRGRKGGLEEGRVGGRVTKRVRGREGEYEEGVCM